MNAQSINTIYLEPIPSVFTITPATLNQIGYVIGIIARSPQSYYELSCVVEESWIDGALATGKVVERDGFLVLANSVARAADQLTQQIEASKQSQDPAIRLHGAMLEECTQGDWLTQIAEEIQMEQENIIDIPQPEFPAFAGMKLRNAERAKIDKYLIYTGERLAAIDSWKQLVGLGVPCNCKPNGQGGNWKLVIPLGDELEILEQVAA